MNNEIQLFHNDEFGDVRTVIIDGEPWFVALDVTRVLGYAKSRNVVSSHVDEDDALIQGVMKIEHERRCDCRFDADIRKGCRSSTFCVQVGAGFRRQAVS